MKHYYGYLCLAVIMAVAGCTDNAPGDEIRFYFGGEKKGYLSVTDGTVYGENGMSYGYDLGTAGRTDDVVFFSTDLDEGNYIVTVVTGDESLPTDCTIKSESRRIMAAGIMTDPGEYKETVFTVNVRSKYFADGDTVNLNAREHNKLIWDDKLTIEINGLNPCVKEIRIGKADGLPTVFIAGNSTVVDEGNEPWTGWGQVFPLFTTPEVVIANYAESGQAANTFVSSRRLEKLMTAMKPGDWLIIEFGHNDQKQKGDGKGAYESFYNDLKHIADVFGEAGGNVILVTPVQRRHFDGDGKLMETHGDHPDAVRKLAADEELPLIDLTEITTRLYTAWGPEDSKKAFVHYPAGTFPGQEQALADNSHFNPYGGYQIAKCVVQAIVEEDLPLRKYIRPEWDGFDPSSPDSESDYTIPATPFASLDKPLGN